MAAHPPDALPTTAGADLSGNGKKRKSDLPDRQPTLSPSVRKFTPSLLSSAEKKLLQGKVANSASTQHKQTTTAAAPQVTDGFSPTRATPSKSPSSARKSRTSSERRKRNNGADHDKDPHQTAQLQSTVSPSNENDSAGDVVEEGTITPVKPGPNRKQVRAEKAAAKATVAAAAARAAAQTASDADAEGTPSNADGRSKPTGKKALRPKEKKKEVKPQQVSNPRMYASVISLLILINTLSNTSDTHSYTKLNEWYAVMDMRPDYLLGGSRTISYDLCTALLRVGGGVDRTVAHHCVHCSEHQLLQCTVADVTVHTITVVRRVTVDEGCTYSLGSSCNQPQVTSFIRRVAYQDRPSTRDRPRHVTGDI